MACSKELYCGICEGRNIYSKAVQYCPECEDALCNTCLEHHSISKATKAHRSISAEDYKNLPSFILDIKTCCDEHNEKYRNYCIFHQHPLCKKCVVSAHKDCKEIEILDDVVRNAKSSTDTENVTACLDETAENFQNIRTEKENNLKTIKQQQNDIRKEIENVYEDLTNHFDKLKNACLFCLNDNGKKHQTRLESFLRDLKERELKLNDLKDGVENIKMHASDHQTFLGMRKIEELVQKEKNYMEDILEKGCLDNVTLLYSRENDVNEIKKRIATFGRITIEKKPSEVEIKNRLHRQVQAPRHEMPKDSNNETSFKEYIGETWTYRALYSYAAGDDDELAIRKGDILQVLDKSSLDWWLCRKLDFQNDTLFQGLVPSNYVQREDPLFSYAWYIGEASEVEKEKLLSRVENINKIGSFLISKSESIDGDACGLCQRLIEPCQREMEDWEVPEDSLDLDKILHNGKFSVVWTGRWNKAVAVAVSSFDSDEDSMNYFSSAMNTLKQCRHEHILKMYGTCTTARLIITELIPKGNLLKFLRGADKTSVKFPALVRTAAQIAEGMAYLELKSIIHKDLKAGNVLLTENHEVKICGFQLSQTLKTDDYDAKKGEKYLVRWSSPEVILYQKFSVKSDVWSYGILLYEMFTYGKNPYEGIIHRDFVQKLQSGYRNPKPDICPDSMYNIMMNCWNKDPASRPTFEFLFNLMDDYFVSTEPYYQEIDD